MRNFSFYNPTRIHFGEGQIDKLAREIPAGSRVLVTHGGGSIFQNGVWQQVEQALAGYTLTRFAGIEANPQFDTLVKAVELGRREGCDFILAVGGGSVIDGSKFIAAALCHAGDPLDLLTGTRAKAALPLGCVLTLAATGSESNPTAWSPMWRARRSCPSPARCCTRASPSSTRAPPSACRPGRSATAWSTPSSTPWSSTSPTPPTRPCRTARPKACSSP